MRLSRIAVVGASLAGLRAVQSLRAEGFDGEIVAVGDEPDLPYDRPPLSKDVLTGKRALADTALSVPGGLAALDAQWLLGRRATGLDVTGGAVRLEDGTAVPFDAAIVATGTRPRELQVPGARLPGVHLLRSLSDARALAEDLERAQRVVVIGAGFIGCEVASACRQRGADVTVLDLEPLPLGLILGDEAGRAVRDLLVDHGVAFRPGVMVERLEGGARVEAVRLASGEAVPADVVVVAIGVVPNSEWLHGSGLTLVDGVVCDATGRAGPGVYAAGDVARWDHPRFGAIRVEHWATAVEHGLYLGRRMLAASDDTVEAFAAVPFFWSDIFDAKLQCVGVLGGGAVRHVVDGLPDGELLVLHERDGVVQAAFGLHCPARILRLRSLMGAASIDEVLAVARDGLPAPRAGSPAGAGR